MDVTFRSEFKRTQDKEDAMPDPIDTSRVYVPEKIIIEEAAEAVGRGNRIVYCSGRQR